MNSLTRNTFQLQCKAISTLNINMLSMNVKQHYKNNKYSEKSSVNC